MSPEISELINLVVRLHVVSVVDATSRYYL